MQLDDKYKDYGYDSGQGDFAERISSLIYRIEGRFSSEPIDGAVTLSTPEVTKLIYDIDVKKLSDAIVDHLKRKGALWILFDNIDKRSEEHTSELQSLMRISYAVFCLTKQNQNQN